MYEQYRTAANKDFFALLDKGLVSSHLFSTDKVDGCDTDHAYRTEQILAHGFGKIIKSSATPSRGDVAYLTSNAICVVISSNGRMITAVPYDADKIRRKFVAFAATQQGKQVCKQATANKTWNIWKW